MWMGVGHQHIIQPDTNMCVYAHTYSHTYTHTYTSSRDFSDEVKKWVAKEVAAVEGPGSVETEVKNES